MAVEFRQNQIEQHNVSVKLVKVLYVTAFNGLNKYVIVAEVLFKIRPHKKFTDFELGP